MSKQTIDKASLTRQIRLLAQRLNRYGLVLFIVFIAALYGFVLLNISTLSNAEPTESAVSGQVKAARTPFIDKKVIDQLQSLQDNSVSVQTLFEEARNNPF